MHRVEVTSAGVMGHEAKVCLEDGTVIKNITSATVYIDVRELTTVNLEVQMPIVSVTAVVGSVNLVCPVCEEHMTHECNPRTLGGT